MVMHTDKRFGIASRVRFGRSLKQDARAELSKIPRRLAARLRYLATL